MKVEHVGELDDGNDAILTPQEFSNRIRFLLSRWVASEDSQPRPASILESRFVAFFDGDIGDEMMRARGYVVREKGVRS